MEQESLRDTYPVLYLYCDWAAHWEIDRNATGRAVLAAISQNWVKVRSGTNHTILMNQDF
jgi:hypothetical protein